MELLGHNLTIGNNFGLYSFISLIILFFIYFLKPKPLKKLIPSIIFLEGQKKKKALVSFFGRFIKDWLFLLQLLVILLLCLSTLELTTILSVTSKSSEVVLVIDASASSQAKEGGSTRFDKSIQIAKDNLGTVNSIVLIKNVPLLVAQQTNSLNARRVLSSLRPTDSTSNIWDAMLMAEDVAESNNAKIIVLSDFIDTNNKDPLVARDILSSKGFDVTLVSTGSIKDNLGIIDFEFADSSANIYIRNFNAESKDITVNNQKIHLAANSVEFVGIPLEEGVNKIEMDTKDDLELDNKVLIYMPETEELNTLVITNKKDTFVHDALVSIPGLKVDVSEPPILQSFNHKIIVFDDVQTEKILSGTYEDLKKAVINGACLIIVVHDNLKDLKLGDLMPVDVQQMEKSTIPIINKKNIDTIQDINFGQSDAFFKAAITNNNTLVVAETIDGIPIITLTKVGAGNVVYYGIIDNYNSFKISLDYPVFWYEMIKKVSNVQSAELLNRRIGEIIYATDTSIKTPDGSTEEDYVTADLVGIYRVGDTDIAVNLLNALESNINSNTFYDSEFTTWIEKHKIEQPVALQPYLIAFIFLLLLAEIFILKKRGEM